MKQFLVTVLLIAGLSDFDPGYTYSIHTTAQYKYKEVPLKFSRSRTCEEITQIIQNLEKQALIAYCHYTMQTNNCMNLIGQPIGNLCINSYGSSFYVKLKDPGNLAPLNKMIAETKTELLEQVPFMNNWFTLRATKNSAGDALAMANYFHESGYFEHSEPGISKYPVE